MAHHIPIGVAGEAEETVELKTTLAAHHPELPPVYSTPDMIRLMETASFVALQPFCEEGEITVGISIHVEHRAATGIGMRVRARAKVGVFDRPFLSHALDCRRWDAGDWTRDGRTGGGARSKFLGKDAGEGAGKVRDERRHTADSSFR